MIYDLKRLELFRDLKITKTELYDNDTDSLYSQDNVEKKVRILPKHIIELLEKYKSKEITEEQFTEWINTVWFSDFFEYCDECSDCISRIVDELEGTDEGKHELVDHKIEKYIQTLLSIDEAAATEGPKMDARFHWRDHLLSIIVGIQVFFAAGKILIYLTYVVGTELSILINPLSIFVLIPYVLIIFLGIEFIREKPFAWYGITSSFLFLLYKNIIEFIILGAFLQFGDSITRFYKMPPREVRITPSIIIPMVVGLIISALVLKLLLQNNTLDTFNIRAKSKLVLILINTGIVIIASAIYFGAGILLVTLRNI